MQSHREDLGEQGGDGWGYHHHHSWRAITDLGYIWRAKTWGLWVLKREKALLQLGEKKKETNKKQLTVFIELKTEWFGPKWGLILKLYGKFHHWQVCVQWKPQVALSVLSEQKLRLENPSTYSPKAEFYTSCLEWLMGTVFGRRIRGKCEVPSSWALVQQGTCHS